MTGAGSLLATTLLGCQKRPVTQEATTVTPEPKPDRIVERLDGLLTAVGARWVVLLQPSRIGGVPWLQAHLGRILSDERLDALASTTGIDVRLAPEVILVGYGDEDTVAYFLRHPSEQALVERRFRARLTGEVRQHQWAHQLITVWGKIGDAPHGYVGVGRDVAGFQYGGDEKRGPMRLAVLYATGKLNRVPRLLSSEGLGPLDEALGDAPAKLLFPGPFEGEMARGARGLFTAAEALGVGLNPTPDERVMLQIVLAGDYGEDDDLVRATNIARLAWNDLAGSSLGHLLGLPTEGVEAEPHPLGLEVTTRLDPAVLADGLAAATMDEVRDIMQ